MSIKVNAIKSLPVDEQWIVKGTKYAEKSWPYTYNRMGKRDIYQRLRNIVKGVIAQESLGFLLRTINISYEIKPREKWYDVNRFDYLVNTTKGKLMIDIKSFFIPRSNLLFKQEGKNYFLDCSALVPKDQIEGREMKDNDIYVFAFIVGKEQKSSEMGLFPVECKWLIHCMWEHKFFKPSIYLNEYGHTPLGTIKVLSSAKNANREFIFGGTAKEKEFYFEKIRLDNKGSSETKKEFFQLFFIRPTDNKLPASDIQIKSEDKKVAIIPATYGFRGPDYNGWDDIWIYDAEIYYVGFATKGYFKNNADMVPRYSKTVKQWEPKTDNYGILCKDLPNQVSELEQFLK